jgi:hypothetical protein
MTTPDLTRRQRDVLRVLGFRASLGVCWLSYDRASLWDLYVPTMMADRHLERLWTLSDKTTAALMDRGLIEFGPCQILPLPDDRLRAGFPVSLPGDRP